VPEVRIIAIGVDGAPGGWLAACLDDDGRTRLELVADVAELAALRDRGGGAAALAIDVPIGLPETVRFRRCDVEARRRLGPRRGSVFAPPARYMLEAAGDYPAIRALVERERRTDPRARGLSAQAAGITRRIAEVDAFVRASRGSERWLWECHPEASFLALNGGAGLPTKHGAAGRAERLRLVRREFADAGDRLAEARRSRRGASPTDVLDAYAALTTAVRCARGEQEELGGGERDAAGLPMRMAV
jgi:predicted RNase H-like nuclease